MVNKPAIGPMLVARRRRWNIFALVLLALAATLPFAVLASAYGWPRPLRLGSATFVGPNCRNTRAIVILRLQPGSRKLDTSELYHPSAAGWERAQMVYEPPRFVLVREALSPRQTGRNDSIVRGKRLWRAGSFAIVLH